jgi:hypothetical protein
LLTWKESDKRGVMEELCQIIRHLGSGIISGTIDKHARWACSVFSDSEEGIISGLFGFKVDWGLVVKTGVESGAVVEGFDVMKDGATRFG